MGDPDAVSLFARPAGHAAVHHIGGYASPRRLTDHILAGVTMSVRITNKRRQEAPAAFELIGLCVIYAPTR